MHRPKRVTGAGLALLYALIAAPPAGGGGFSGPVFDIGLAAELVDVVQLPATASGQGEPVALVGTLREAPDGSGRIFISDHRGPLYILDGSTLHTYMDLSVLFPSLRTGTGRSDGFASFALHPAFQSNGLLYTAHREELGAIPPTLGPALPAPISHHVVITEWTANDPSASTFSGSSRELMRIASPHNAHNTGELAFDPNAVPGDDAYGLLFIAGGDFGSVRRSEPEQLQRLDTPYGTLMRIDPLGGLPYGIPSSNPFANDGDPDTLGEIYAYGFRNAHRLVWDPAGEGTLFATDIGEDNLEEIDIIVSGGNYGWPAREGTYALDVETDPGELLALPPNDASLGFRYPVAQYDHEEGFAIAGGAVYRGGMVSELQGKFVFGDIVTGRVLYADVDELIAADDGDPVTTAPIFELTILRAGVATPLLDVVRDAVGNPSLARTDLRFGVAQRGVYLTTKQDGFVRRLVPLAPCSDRADNDGDGFADYAPDGNGDGVPDPPGDPGCTGPENATESPQCQDGIDNDPGQDDPEPLIDFDGGQSIHGLCSGGSCPPGVSDPDRDGVADPDPQCGGVPSNWENRPRSCGLGAELGALLPALWGLGRLRRRGRARH